MYVLWRVTPPALCMHAHDCSGQPGIPIDNSVAGGGDDRAATPDELEFEDDDGTMYRWDAAVRKYIPADGSVAVQQQQQQPI